MSSERYQKLEEMAASLFSDYSQALTVAEPSQSTSADPEMPCEDIPSAMPELGAAAPNEDEGENETTMTDQPAAPLAGLSLDTTIHLRWTLRDIKSKRIRLSPVSPDDLGPVLN